MEVEELLAVVVDATTPIVVNVEGSSVNRKVCQFSGRVQVIRGKSLVQLPTFKQKNVLLRSAVYGLPIDAVKEHCCGTNTLAHAFSSSGIVILRVYTKIRTIGASPCLICAGAANICRCIGFLEFVAGCLTDTVRQTRVALPTARRLRCCICAGCVLGGRVTVGVVAYGVGRGYVVEEKKKHRSQHLVLGWMADLMCGGS